MEKHMLPYSVKNLIPHSGAMLFVDEILAVSASGAKCFYKASENIFSQGRFCSPFLFVELFAQSAAAFSAYKASTDEKKAGFLTGLENLMVNFLPVHGDEIEIKISKTEELGPLSFFECSAEKNNFIMASGIIKVWSGDVQEHAKAAVQSFSRGPVLNDVMKYIRNIDTVNNSIEAFLAFEKDFCCFNGHFEGMPVVPGIALMQAAIIIAERFSGKKFAVSRIVSAKFSRRINPGEEVKFSITPLSGKVTISVNGERAAFFAMEISEVTG